MHNDGLPACHVHLDRFRTTPRRPTCARTLCSHLSPRSLPARSSARPISPRPKPTPRRHRSFGLRLPGVLRRLCGQPSQDTQRSVPGFADRTSRSEASGSRSVGASRTTTTRRTRATATTAPTSSQLQRGTPSAKSGFPAPRRRKSKMRQPDRSFIAKDGGRGRTAPGGRDSSERSEPRWVHRSEEPRRTRARRCRRGRASHTS
jgi:hypothetical protein